MLRDHCQAPPELFRRAVIEAREMAISDVRGWQKLVWKPLSMAFFRIAWMRVLKALLKRPASRQFDLGSDEAKVKLPRQKPGGHEMPEDLCGQIAEGHPAQPITTPACITTGPAQARLRSWTAFNAESAQAPAQGRFAACPKTRGHC